MESSRDSPLACRNRSQTTRVQKAKRTLESSSIDYALFLRLRFRFALHLYGNIYCNSRAKQPNAYNYKDFPTIAVFRFRG